MPRWCVVTLLVTFGLVASRETSAQPLVCQTIQPGDTASAMARRLTGRASSRHQPWFRIVDARGSTVIPKARYDRIVAGWRACVPAAQLAARASAAPRTDPARHEDAIRASSVAPVAAGPVPPDVASTRRNTSWNIVYLCWAAAVIGAAIGLGWHALDQFLTRRRALMREMQAFATLFVKDFERPLVIDGIASRPIRARLRYAPGSRRLDVLLAPAAGRRYPNLDDHRKNVEYDVETIAHRLRHYPFARRPLRAEGQWVVIPFEFEPGPKPGAVV